MKIILRQNVPNLGEIGEVVTVKSGYARNFLIPRQLAYVATDSAMRALETEKKQYAVKMEKAKQSAEVVAAQLADLQVSIPMQVGEEGRLFGSVTGQMIAQELDSISHSSSATEDRWYGSSEQCDIFPKPLMVNVMKIHSHPFIKGDLRPTTDLPLAGNSRQDIMSTLLPIRALGRFASGQGTRPHKRHVSSDDVEQLWQFIKTRST